MIPYSPSFVIKIKGKELRHGVAENVVSLSVTDTCDRADSFNLRISDRHEKQGRFAAGASLKWMDDTLFDEGTEIEIELGYVNRMTFKFKGEITAVSASFPATGIPELQIRGFSHYHRLQRKRRTKPFESAKASDIAKEIAKDMGFLDDVDPTDAEHPHTLSEDETYESILKGKARPIGYEVAVKNKTLIFQKPGYIRNPSPEFTLEWGKDLDSFSPTIGTYSMPTEVVVRAAQTSSGGAKSALVGTAKAGEERVKMGDKTGSEIAKEIFGDNPVKITENAVATQKEARDIALAQLETKSLDFITARASCIGNPDIAARKVLKIKGAGKRYSGNYYVTSVTHTVDARGFLTSFEMKRNGR
jgi:phage protein D